MSRASERLSATTNHLHSQAPNMAAANNFYSIVAGVGAGTGKYDAKMAFRSISNI
jgi:hypothetical protein